MKHSATKEELLLEKFLRERENNEIVWATKQGDQLPLKSISDSHLDNILAMLDRQEQLESMFDECPCSIEDCNA